MTDMSFYLTTVGLKFTQKYVGTGPWLSRLFFSAKLYSIIRQNASCLKTVTYWWDDECSSTKFPVTMLQIPFEADCKDML